MCLLLLDPYQNCTEGKGGLDLSLCTIAIHGSSSCFFPGRRVGSLVPYSLGQHCLLCDPQSPPRVFASAPSSHKSWSLGWNPLSLSVFPLLASCPPSPLVRLTVGLFRIWKAFAQEVAICWVLTGHRLAEDDFISPVGNSAWATMLGEGGTYPGNHRGDAEGRDWGQWQPGCV